MSLGKIVRGGLWLYLSSLTNNILGFFYWMIISAIGGSTVLGITTAIVGFSSMITSILGLGIFVGIQRYIGLFLGEKNYEKIRVYFWTSLYFRTIINVTIGTILIILSQYNIMLFNLKPEMLRIAGLIVLINSFTIFTTVPLSFIDTKINFLSNTVSQLTKFVTGITLVYLGFGWIGAVTGSIMYATLNIIILGIYTLKHIYPLKTFDIKALKDVVSAGISSWLPGMIAMVTQQTGILAVFGTSGASETGYYYVANSISNVVIMLGSSMLGLLLPLLSSMKDGRKRANWRALRLSLAIMTPAILFIILYPWLPLSLLGKEYIAASIILIVLSIKGIPASIIGAINSLIYSYGLYKYILILGLFQNIPSMILYSILVPKYHGLGAALSVTMGSIIGLIVALVLARKIQYRIIWKEIIYILTPPSLIGAFCFFTKLNWFLGGILILTVSAFSYIKLGIITKKDLKEISSSIIPEPQLKRIIPYVKPLLDLIYGF